VFLLVFAWRPPRSQRRAGGESAAPTEPVAGFHGSASRGRPRWHGAGARL